MTVMLVELRTEEIPAGYLDRALAAFRDEVHKGMSDARIDHGEVGFLGTPRRMTVFARDVVDRQPDRRETVQGPAEKAAFDPDGKPTRAVEGFARSQGVSVEALQVRETRKGRYICLDKVVEGKAVAELLPDILTAAVSRISFPKRMRWAARDFTFARPIRGILALLGDRVLDWELSGVRAGNVTRGHPFLAPESIPLVCADVEAYISALHQAYVVVDPTTRREAVEASLHAAAEQAGGTYRDEGLVAEVTHMVEYPGVLEARFDARFLELPAVVIEAVLRTHQRYFSVLRPEGGLAETFLSVVDRPAEKFEKIRDGNERVVRARLVDAEFFLAEDSRTRLVDRLESLDQVIFLKGLGTLGDRVKRLRPLARSLGMALHGAETAERAERAANLAKCDLTTNMVGEFPELQGAMGEVYARTLDGEEPEVAAAIREHYQPQGPEDDLPATPTGNVVALADRLDLLTGCFLKGLEPSGSRDPYGLRRAARGLLRILLAGEQSLDLKKWIEKAASGYSGLLAEADTPRGPLASLGRYLRERIQAHFIDQGMHHDLVGAAVATDWGDVKNLEARLEALQAMQEDDRFPALVELVERTHNISKNLDKERPLRPDLFTEAVEQEVFDTYQALERPLCRAFSSGEYTEGSWRYLEGLGGLMQRYFEEVFVNVEDPRVKHNRWTLLRAIHCLYRDHVADLSRVPRPPAEKGQ